MHPIAPVSFCHEAFDAAKRVGGAAPRAPHNVEKLSNV